MDNDDPEMVPLSDYMDLKEELDSLKSCMCDGGGSVAHVPNKECTSGPFYNAVMDAIAWAMQDREDARKNSLELMRRIESVRDIVELACRRVDLGPQPYQHDYEHRGVDARMEDAVDKFRNNGGKL